MKNTLANQSCLWCYVHKRERWDMSKDWPIEREFYWDIPTIKRKGRGQQDIPILNIDIKQVIPDELHLMLRITDVLLDLLIREVTKTDESEGQKKIVNEMKRIGLSFKFWGKDSTEKGDGDMRKKNYTSLQGPEKRILLAYFEIKNVINDPVRAAMIQHLWDRFRVLYKSIRRKFRISNIETKGEAGQKEFSLLCNSQKSIKAVSREDKDKVQEYFPEDWDNFMNDLSILRRELKGWVGIFFLVNSI
jgi:hypothetical protein